MDSLAEPRDSICRFKFESRTLRLPNSRAREGVYDAGFSSTSDRYRVMDSSVAPNDSSCRFKFESQIPRLPSWNRHEESLGATEESIRSEEHTSELQSLTNLVCRLLLVK